MQPTPGRIIWFYYNKDQRKTTQPLAGVVTFVSPEDNTINAVIFEPPGCSFTRVGLRMIDAAADEPDENFPQGEFACWMPYQKQQANKQDSEGRFKALEDAVAQLMKQVAENSKQASAQKASDDYSKEAAENKRTDVPPAVKELEKGEPSKNEPSKSPPPVTNKPK
jgi:hypothetical protein